MRILGGELLKAMVPNDGKRLAVALQEGEAVSLHLPPDGLRVLTASEPVEDAEVTGADVPAA